MSSDAILWHFLQRHSAQIEVFVQHDTQTRIGEWASFIIDHHIVIYFIKVISNFTVPTTNHPIYVDRNIKWRLKYNLESLILILCKNCLFFDSLQVMSTEKLRTQRLALTTNMSKYFFCHQKSKIFEVCWRQLVFLIPIP